jgi:YVTN family beta-propeller protein
MPKGTVTMLFTDIEGSTRLLKQLGAEYGALLDEHRRILRASFDAFGGREMDTQGDAFFAVFDRARNAVGAAVQAQRALAGASWPEGAECRVRMGLHTGEPEVGEEGYHGMAVHRGARIAAAAHGGQILLSDATRQLVEDDLPAGAALRDLGVQQLKDIERPEHVYQVVVDGLQSQFPPLRTVASAERGKRRRRTVALAVAALVGLAAVAAVALVESVGSSSSQSHLLAANSVGVYDASSGKMHSQFALDVSPSAVAAGFGSLWVVDAQGDSVSRVDPDKGVVNQTIDVGHGPAGIAVGAGYVWVANGLDGTVAKIDPKTNSVVDTINGVGNGPDGLAIGGGFVWVATSNDSGLTRIGVADDEVAGRIAVPGGANGVAVGFGSVWVTGQNSGDVNRIDMRTHSVLATLHSGSGAGPVVAGAGAVWTANTLDGTVTEVDPATTKIRATIPVGSGPNSITAQPGAVWTANGASGTLSSIDPGRATVSRTVPTGSAPAGLAIEGGRLYATVQGTGAGHRGGTLRVGVAIGNLDSTDPMLAYSPRSWQLLILTNDGLVGFRRTGGPAGSALVPDLATAIPSPTDGGKSWSFQVRRGIRYSTGEPVRASDFKRTVERALHDSDSPGYLYFAGIVGAEGCIRSPKHCDLSKGVVADDSSNTVTFHLTAPDPDLPYKLALPFAYAVPPSTPLAAGGTVAATGPYKIAKSTPSEIRLVRNPYFRQWSSDAQPEGFPNEIVERFDGTSDRNVAAVIHGKADLAMDVSQASARNLRMLTTQHASRIELSPVAGTIYFFFGTRIKPFDDVRARRAVNYAVDRNKMLQAYGGPDLGLVTCQILPPNFTAYRPYCPYTVSPSPSGAYSGPDLARAKALVAASGTKGEPVTVWAPQFLASSGRYLVSVLNNLGYRARLHTSPHPDKEMAAAAAGKLQVGGIGWFADYASPSGFFPPALACASYVPGQPSSNAGGFCDHSIDREMARAAALQSRDPQAAAALWGKVDRDSVDEAPWVSIVNPRNFDFISGRVGNYQYNPQWGTLLDQLWVSSS